MSTKALRWLLSDYVSVCAARNGEFGAREPDESERAAYQAALAEVEAIERAAKVVADGKVYGGLQSQEAAFVLLESIAKDAP